MKRELGDRKRKKERGKVNKKFFPVKCFMTTLRLGKIERESKVACGRKFFFGEAS